MLVRRIQHFRYHSKRQIKYINNNNSTGVKRRIVDDEWWSSPSSTINDKLNDNVTSNINVEDYTSVDRDIMPVGTTIHMDNITSQYSGFEERYTHSYASNWVRDQY